MTHDVTAGVDDEGLRPEQRFDFVEQEESLIDVGDQARGGRVEDESGAFDLRGQRRNRCVARGALCPNERSPGAL